MISSFFRTRKPRKFDFKSRYYDAEKEDLQRRIKMAEFEADPRNAEKVGYIEKWKKNSRLQESQRSNRRILVIAGMLALVAYLYFKFA